MITRRIGKKRLLRRFAPRNDRLLRSLAMTSMVLLFIFTYLVSAPPWARADIPRYINYQGKLTDADDNPITADVSITVRIYDAASGGTALWEEVQAVTATRGIFSMLLGSTTALDDLDFDDAYWYSVEVESDGEMTPRQRLTAVAYAINADKLDGYDASDFLRIAPDGEMLVTGGANENIELNPTGTGNVVITIDSTSGDFKVTDGTTNFLLVDNDTGNVSIAKSLTISENLTVTGNIALDGNISDASGAVTIPDAITQTGSSNQVTFAGNVDAGNGLDVTGALTVSGTTTLADTLDVNKNIDLDYSGTSAALNVAQAGAGTAATFTGGEVVIGSDTANTYAVSAGELYVQGDLEVDGTIYGDITATGTTALGDATLDSLTVTGTSDLQGNVADSAGTYTIADDVALTPAALTSGGTDDYALSIAQTLNDTDAAGGSDVYRGIKVNVTETDKTGWDNVYLMDLQVDDTSKFNINDSGNATFAGTVTGGTPTASTHLTTKYYVDNIVPSSAGGWTDGGTGVYLLTATDNVGIGTNSTNTYKLNVDGSANVTSLYIDGTQITTSASDLNDVVILSPTSTQTITAGSATVTPLILKGAASQSGDLFDVQDSSATSHLTVEADGDIQIDTSGNAALSSITQSDVSASIAIATDTSQLGGGAGADSDGVLKLGINEGNYQYIWYDTNGGTDNNGAFIFSDQTVIPSSSPAYLSFGANANNTLLYALKLDPD
ncbi:MAG: hypothetical protein KJ706_09520, partial [Candidatus Omnitrophica bacterium]|nr:hypothetical protein [Candidatus Omnitrophota bacterium]